MKKFLVCIAFGFWISLGCSSGDRAAPTASSPNAEEASPAKTVRGVTRTDKIAQGTLSGDEPTKNGAATAPAPSTTPPVTDSASAPLPKIRPPQAKDFLLNQPRESAPPTPSTAAVPPFPSTSGDASLPPPLPRMETPREFVSAPKADVPPLPVPEATPSPPRFTAAPDLTPSARNPLRSSASAPASTSITAGSRFPSPPPPTAPQASQGTRPYTSPRFSAGNPLRNSLRADVAATPTEREPSGGSFQPAGGASPPSPATQPAFRLADLPKPSAGATPPSPPASTSYPETSPPPPLPVPAGAAPSHGGAFEPRIPLSPTGGDARNFTPPSSDNTFNPGGGSAQPLLDADSAKTEEDSSESKVVKVFYATDRRLLTAFEQAQESRKLWTIPIATILLIAIIMSGTAVIRGQRKLLAGLSLVGVVGVLIGSFLVISHLSNALSHSPDASVNVANADIEYGSERGDLQLGVCEVSIPHRHQPGEMEAPSIWRLEFSEREDRHIVLKSVMRHSDLDFYQQVKERVRQSPRNDLFVFIHGYNVTFESAAKRTAQMATDLRFEGAPIFYSWPSQGELLDYSVDENNVAWTVPHLKQFLLDVAKKSEAKAVNLIAHSMGNRALTCALRELAYEMRSDKAIFNQVILAAPDIDADIFKRDIAPAIAKSANRVTLYASSRDQALKASKVVHGYARAGDSGDGLVIVPGIETVDVSEIDTSLLGHSYYSGNEPIIHDLYALLRESRAANLRPWLKAADQGGQGYWVFDEELATASRFGSRQ